MNTEIKMIDQIQKTLGQIEAQQKKSSKPSIDTKTIENIGNSIIDSEGDSAKITDILKSENVSKLATKAPINLDEVSAIKNAIAKGDYPIDIDRIADALMDVYREMKS